MPETRGLSFEELEAMGYTISEYKPGRRRVDFRHPPAGKVFVPIPIDDESISRLKLDPRFVTRRWFGGTRMRVLMILMDEGDTWRVRRFVKGIKLDNQKQERKNRCWIISPKTGNKIMCPEENRCRKDNCPKKQGLWTGHFQEISFDVSTETMNTRLYGHDPTADAAIQNVMREQYEDLLHEKDPILNDIDSLMEQGYDYKEIPKELGTTYQKSWFYKKRAKLEDCARKVYKQE